MCVFSAFLEVVPPSNAPVIYAGNFSYLKTKYARKYVLC